MSTPDVSTTPFQQALAALARGEQGELDHLLLSYETPLNLDGTRTTVRTHFLAVDANGMPAVDRLAEAMAVAAMEFCVPRSRIQHAATKMTETGSPSYFARLEKQAKELFVDADGTGEGGELLLFLLMERVLKLPQLLAKMSLKTNSNMHVHGSDGVHAQIGTDGVLELSWGESKLYGDISKAIKDCFESIAPFLADIDESRKRDLLLIRDNLNVDNEELATHVLEYFDETNSKSLDVRWHGVCLIGFNYASYPNLKKLAANESEKISKAVARWHKAVSGRVGDHSLVDVNIEVFCIPFPSVDALRKSVRKNLGIA